MAALSDMLVYLRKQNGLSQQELAARLEMTRSAISMYETGQREPNLETLEAFADFYHVDMNTLTGRNTALSPGTAHNVSYVPRIGPIVWETPLLVKKNILGHVLLPDGVKADFALHYLGDSMIDASIDDGDTVFIRAQPEVENGEIAAVLIGTEATLKRVYRNGGVLTLMAANKAYTPLSYTKDNMDCVKIIGKAIAILKLL